VQNKKENCLMRRQEKIIATMLIAATIIAAGILVTAFPPNAGTSCQAYNAQLKTYTVCQ
jgi:hypothetical protein